MIALWIFMILALASPIIAEDNLEVKKQEKRGVIGLGYGNNNLHGLGYGNVHGLGYGTNYLAGHGYGYNALGHGLGLGNGLAHSYVNAPVYPALKNVVAPPTISHAPLPHLPLSHGYAGYSHGYQAPLYNAPIRVGYAGLGHNVHGYGYGLGNGW